MNVSLSKFAREHGLHKSAVYRRCQELKISTSCGLSPEVIECLEHEFSAEIAQHESRSELTADKIKTVVVESGNHQVTLLAPALPQTYSLESLRNGEAVSFEDPMAIAHQFLEASELILAGMDADIRQRQQKLKTTQQAKDAIAQKRQKLELETRLYQLQTEQLDDALSSETTSLQDQLKELQRLGKSSAS